MIIWIAFLAFVVVALALDLGVFNRTPHVISTKEAVVWTSIWVFCASAFSVVIYFSFLHGWVANPTGLSPSNAVTKYLTAYLVEKSLSVDNIFVIALIFSSFAIPRKYQHEVLFYGVLGAIAFRAIMIFLGVTLIQKFDWVIYLFGLFLLLTAVKMLLHRGQNPDPHNSRVFRLIKRFYPVTHQVEGDHFFLKKEGITYITPLFVALVVIEFMDLAFAVDSIPAVLAITADPFLVFTSNIFAILGLRSLFFLLSGVLYKMLYINYSLVAILAFVGVKMLLSHHVHFPEWFSLGVIVLALAGGIGASLLFPAAKAEEKS